MRGNNGKTYCLEGNFGIERETLRVDARNRISQKQHMFHDSHLVRDFCESQLEIVTPVCHSVSEAMQSLHVLSEQARSEMASYGEHLWMQSNPPYIESEDEIVIARYEGQEAYKQQYRRKLESRYGKRKMLYSGIHFNFSFPDAFFEASDAQELQQKKNEVYFRLMKQVSRYSWLLVLLTAASPICDRSLFEPGACGAVIEDYASRRNSEEGYWNHFIPELNYEDLASYCDSVQQYVDEGTLLSATELYLPVRVKPRGENSLEALQKHGIDHIELRMFDLNPLAEEGIRREDLEFAHYFMLYLLQLPDLSFDAAQQRTAICNHKNAAHLNLEDVMVEGCPILLAAQKMLDAMSRYFKDEPLILESIRLQSEKLQKNKRYAQQISQDFLKKMQSA